MKKLIVLSLIFIASVARSNGDYILTQNGDTIYGNILRVSHITDIKVIIQTEEGKKRIRFKDMSHYQRNGVKFINVRISNAKGRIFSYHCREMNVGIMRFLLETGTEADEHFVHYKDQYYRLNKRYLSDELWEIMRECSGYHFKYQEFYELNRNKRIMYFPKQNKIWFSMIQDYNSLCPE